MNITIWKNVRKRLVADFSLRAANVAYVFLLLNLLIINSDYLTAQSAQLSIGIPTFSSNVKDIPDGSLLLLGEAAERGLIGRGGLRIIDRRRLDAIMLARQEVRHEDYLASDRESIAAIGANYLLIGRILEREISPNRWTGPDGFERGSISISYRLRLTALNVANKRNMLSEEVSLQGFMSIRTGEPEMQYTIEQLLPQIERQAAGQLTPKVTKFVTQAFSGGMQMVDILHQKGRKINDILIASTLTNDWRENLKLYYQEEYEIDGEILIRPVMIAEGRVRRRADRLVECRVTEGANRLYAAHTAGHTIYAIPKEQEVTGLVRLLTLGQ